MNRIVASIVIMLMFLPILVFADDSLQFEHMDSSLAGPKNKPANKRNIRPAHVKKKRKAKKRQQWVVPEPEPLQPRSIEFKFVQVKGGCFQMGDTFGDGYSSEKPVHEVCVSSFNIGKYEVTQRQWRQVMGSNPSYNSTCGDNCPVENVSWNDIQKFIGKLNTAGVIQYRLPTEAEWEYAARSGGKSEKYSGGDNVDAVAWYSGNSGARTHPAGEKRANGLGIYDMSGNVYEWVQDWWGGYPSDRQQDPQGPSTGSERVLRGGSSFEDQVHVPVSSRSAEVPSNRSGSLGFRLVYQIIKPKEENPFRDPTTDMEFMPVKGGCFQMGDTFGDGYSDEKPVHEVCVSSFNIGMYEVTQGQWRFIMGSNPSHFSTCGDNCPVENVSWNDIQKFIGKLNTLGAHQYRLPTEAEWEYAARSGGKSEKYSGGDDVDAVAWYSGNSGGRTHRVGEKRANGLGIYDMSGNVYEWVQDWWGGYPSDRQQDPQGPSTGTYRMFRGGCLSQDGMRARAAGRNGFSPDYRGNCLGFRLVSTVQ
jgi:formylglycine-generating enzyme